MISAKMLTEINGYNVAYKPLSTFLLFIFALPFPLPLYMLHQHTKYDVGERKFKGQIRSLYRKEAKG